MTETISDISIVPDKTKQRLNPRQFASYREHRKNLIQWMLNLGKEPEKAEGYAEATVRTRAKRLDKFYRWVWENESDGYTERITTDHADSWMKDLAHTEYSSSYKACCQKACKTLFKWQGFQKGEDVNWEPVIKYSDSTGTDQPRDFLTRNERKRFREAVLEYGCIPHYNSLSPEEREEWKSYLAQRFEKPKEEVTRSDWSDANSFKMTSLVWTSVDAGFRPIEVARAKTSWVDLDNSVLRIPKEDSSKNRGNWTVSLLDRTTLFLEKWMNERQQRDKYSGTDKLWLTRQGNPYSSQSLGYWMEKLCKEAGIPIEDRDISWYSIRHSVGTYMAREEGLAAAQAQLRHNSERTTMKYDQAPIEDRKNALQKMG